MLDYRSRRMQLRRGPQKIMLLSQYSKLIFFGVLGLIFLIFGVFLWFSRDLPTPGKLSASSLSESTKIYDRHGIVLYDIYGGEKNRTYVELKNIAKPLQQATIATEDKDFYTNQGFSITGYLRSVRNFFIARGINGGGSTLTQQLVKNTLLSSEQTLPRKIKEFILAIQVDKKYSKDQILELYLNVAPYGGTAVGVESASELYFNKKAKDLTLLESAILAGLPQLPSYYSPYGPYPTAFKGRTKDVLRRMREDGDITPAQEQQALKDLEKVKFEAKNQTVKAPHFAFYVKDLLIKQFGENYVENGGLHVTTTLDYKLQSKAEDIVKEEVNNARSLKVGNGAAAVINPQNGEILALVGSKDFFAGTTKDTKDTKNLDDNFQGQFNVMTQGLRQPGSTIKVVNYATALEKGYTAATMIMDTKTTFPGQGGKDYAPVNYDGKYHGPVQLRFALGSSLNIPAVKLLAMVGIKNMLTTANNLGLTSFAPTPENISKYGLAITLGGGDVRPLDLAEAYSAFANGGYRVDEVAILKVTDRNGKVLYEHEDSEKKRVIPEEVAFIISHMLLDNNARLLTFGANSYLNIFGRPIAVKTGTTDDKRDNWTIGWTPSVLVATWVGNNDNSPMGAIASGVTGAAPIWRRIMLEALKEYPATDFKKPDNVIAVTIDALGGGTPVDGKPTRVEYFIKGTEPQGPAAIYKEIKVSKSDNNKLASDSEISKHEYDIKKFIVFEEKDPISADGKNRWQEGIDAWVKENHSASDTDYYPPTEKSDKVISDSPTDTPTPSGNTPTPTP